MIRDARAVLCAVCAGYGGQGQLGSGSKENLYAPKRVEIPSTHARPVAVVSKTPSCAAFACVCLLSAWSSLEACCVLACLLACLLAACVLACCGCDAWRCYLLLSHHTHLTSYPSTIFRIHTGVRSRIHCHPRARKRSRRHLPRRPLRLVRKRSFLRCHFKLIIDCIERSFYQARLGTNVGKAPKREPFSCSGENGLGQLGLGHTNITLRFERAALGTESAFFCATCTKNDPFGQDRLGTNTGRVEEEGHVLCR